MGYLAAFLGGAVFGAITLIVWSLAAIQKKDSDNE